MLFFVLGLLLGGMIGMLTMCMLQINRFEHME